MCGGLGVVVVEEEWGFCFVFFGVKCSVCVKVVFWGWMFLGGGGLFCRVMMSMVFRFCVICLLEL